MTRLKIRTRLLLALAIPLLALGGLGVRYLTTINEVEVDGRLYDQVTGPRAVVADVALLAENQSRALIDAQDLLGETDPVRIEGLLADLAIREERYLAGAEEWNSGRAAEQPELESLLRVAYEPSVEFYRIINEELVPAVEAQNPEATESAVAAVGRAFARERAAADQVIQAALREAESSEAEAAAYLNDRLRQDQLVAGALVLIAVGLGLIAIRSITRPLRRLEEDLPKVADDLRTMDLAVERPEVGHLAVDSHDELAQATRAFNSVVDVSVDLAVEQARVRQNQAETLQHLGRRNQNLLRRMMAIITDLENVERDPDALDELFRLDHIATRMRRNAESLLVLAGSEQTRRWSEPVPIIDVLRSAASEIEDYNRIDLTNLEPVVVQGSSAADVSHLLAELLENATLYSPPTARVIVTGRRVRAGYQIAVVDQGLGLDEPSLARANDRILDAAASMADLTDSKLLGLHVVGRLADRHATEVALAPNPAGGLIAVVTLPRAIVAMPPTSAGVIPKSGGPLPAAAAPSPAPAAGPGPAGPATAVMTTVPATPTGNGSFAAPEANGPAAPPAPINAASPAAPFAPVAPVPFASPFAPDTPAPSAAPSPPVTPLSSAAPSPPVTGAETPAPSPPVTPLASAAPNPPVTGVEPPSPSLRRRVRVAEDAMASEAPAVVHGPSRGAEDVRDSWSRLAQGVRQARNENPANHEEATQ